MEITCDNTVRPRDIVTSEIRHREVHITGSYSNVEADKWVFCNLRMTGGSQAGRVGEMRGQ